MTGPGTVPVARLTGSHCDGPGCTVSDCHGTVTVARGRTRRDDFRRRLEIWHGCGRGATENMTVRDYCRSPAHGLSLVTARSRLAARANSETVALVANSNSAA